MSKSPAHCNGCGYDWDTSAKIPRCPECGSRKIDTDDEPDPEPIENDDAEEIEEPDDPEPIENDDDSDDEEDTDDDSADADDDATYTPTFESINVTADAGPLETAATEATENDTDDDAEEIEDDDGDEQADDAADDAPEIELDPETLQPAIQSTFSVIDSRMLTDWAITEEESEQLARGWCPVANKWAPHLMATHGVEAVAVITTMAVLGPKLAAESTARKKQKQREEATTADEPDPEPVEPDGPSFEIDAEEETTDDQPAALSAV